MVITIDGPVASGKSTVALLLAKELGFFYLYTGLFYRGIAYVLVNQFGYDRERLKAPLSQDLATVVSELTYDYAGGMPHLYYQKTDITPFLKTAEIDDLSSLSSTDAQVRKAVLDKQIYLGEHFDIVADGRDMGTVVFPGAVCKFFLTASLPVRAQRWQKDQARLNNLLSVEKAKEFITERDTRDRTRTQSPLVPADDAVIIDNSDYSIAETVALMHELVMTRCYGHHSCSCCG